MTNALFKWKDEIHRRDGYVCGYCGDEFSRSELHVDHIVPRSEVGVDRKENLISACIRCNLTKSNLSAEAFILKAIRKRDEHAAQVVYWQKIINNFQAKKEKQNGKTLP